MDLNEKLLENLRELKIIESSKLDNIYEQSKKSSATFEELLLDNDLISGENLGKIKADIKIGRAHV